MKRERAKSSAVIEHLTPFDILKEEITKKNAAMQAMLEESSKREAKMLEESSKREAAMLEESARTAKREAEAREDVAALKEEVAKRDAAM